MSSLVRGVIAAFSAVAALYLVGLFGGIVVYVTGLPSWIPFLASLGAAWWAGRFMWHRTSDMEPGLLESAARGAFGVGAVGFIGGFFGPMILTPGANQGPMLGIFITGPLGFLIGGVGGAVRWFMRTR